MRLKIIKGKNKVNQEITKYTAKKKEVKGSSAGRAKNNDNSIDL